MVFPGAEEIFAKFFLPQIILMREDLPTLDLPINAYSGKEFFGHLSTSVLLTINSELRICMRIIISKFGKRPMHLFGRIGFLMLLIGFLFATYLGYDKLFVNPYGKLITERSEFYISLATMIIGSQFFAIGFIGELILRYNQSKIHYRVRQEVNL